ncbi:MAG: phosphoglycerate dehydrogenase [Alphaproteobacteria bacterium]|nr:MAG: phosphoglycerate dehydrogenase [Alphaproteobacteria bacterium]
MTKVLISDKLSPRAAEIFKERGVEVDQITGMSPEELIACIGDYDGLAIRSATKVTEEILAAATNLKVVGRAGIGVDNIDIPAATSRGVVVMNTPFGNSITTAEHAIALMFALARQIPLADRSTQEGKWEKSRFMGVELTGKTLGLIGCGNIGSLVAERALGLRMKVVAFDPYLSPERAIDLGVEKVELDALFARADVVTLHTPLTDSTRGIIDAAAIAKMKDGVRIINCARGGLVVEADLLDGLNSGKIAGAAFDVFENEPATENALFGHENFIATPHLGASTAEAQVNVAVQVAEQMSDYLVDGAVTNALNMPSVSAEEAPRLKPYMVLAEQLGSFIGQIAESGITQVDVEYEGHATTINTSPLTSIILQSLLAPVLDVSVNMVNAETVAKDRNIDVCETKHSREGDYTTLIRLTVKSQKTTRVIEGTLFSDQQPRIVHLMGIDVEAQLAPHMLFVRNVDEPGFIGALGTILGEAGVNIANFNLGRASSAEDNGALALIHVDEEISQELLRKVCALPQVKLAKALSF